MNWWLLTAILLGFCFVLINNAKFRKKFQQRRDQTKQNGSKDKNDKGI